MVRIGDCVVYRHEDGKPHDALVTAIHGSPEDNPSINLVFVNGEKGVDQYGEQIQRETSIVHSTNQSAQGRFWYNKP